MGRVPLRNLGMTGVHVWNTLHPCRHMVKHTSVYKKKAPQESNICVCTGGIGQGQVMQTMAPSEYFVTFCPRISERINFEEEPTVRHLLQELANLDLARSLEQGADLGNDRALPTTLGKHIHPNIVSVVELVAYPELYSSLGQEGEEEEKDPDKVYRTPEYLRKHSHNSIDPNHAV